MRLCKCFIRVFVAKNLAFMSFQIKKVVVIGSGTMGGGIAAHAANAGIPVYLLDIVPGELTADEAKKGLTLDNPVVRNRVVNQGLERIIKSKPQAPFTTSTVNLITVGNLIDNEAWIGEADWIVEAIIEKMPEKHALAAQIERLRKPNSIVSSNTSGLPIADIAAKSSQDFKDHFIGTHFFNPPRYMKLLEVIPTANTKPEITAFITKFCEEKLGKGVVICKDTPNFIANRMSSMTSTPTLSFAVDNGYTIEEVDTIAGPLIGRPKTASFRLMDLVGIDVAHFVGQNLYDLIPNDESRDVLSHAGLKSLITGMMADGKLGDKTGKGFYQKPAGGTKGSILSLDLKTKEYRERIEPEIPSIADGSKIRSLPERMKFILAQEDKAGSLARQVIYHSMAYASRRIPEMADDILSVDNAVRWGFAHEMGPFETWDALGVRETAAAMEAGGFPVAGWVNEMLADGIESFYKEENGKLNYYDPATKNYVTEADDLRRINLRLTKSVTGTVRSNKSASLVDLGDGVLCLEFHSKMNSLDDGILDMTREAIAEVEANWEALVIGNQGSDFSVGANLANLAIGIEAKAFDGIENGVAAMQDAFQAVRFCAKPVVTAPFGRTLGGGVEAALAGTKMVAASETYMGLVEVGVGLLPGAGGCKELVRRVVSIAMQGGGQYADPLPSLQKVLENIGMAKVSTSAANAREMGYLTASDEVVMSRDFQIAAAKKAVLDLAAAGYVPPINGANCYAAGRSALATLKIGLFMLAEAGWASEFDKHVAEKVAHVICGGELTSGQWTSEQYFLDLEREAFISLCGEAKTLERIKFMLAKGKALRN